MSNETVTSDLSEFGYIELKEAGKLLTAYCDNTAILDGDNVKLWFNKNSGYVFLCDEDYNTAMLNGDDIELWRNCPMCGYEEFNSEIADCPEDHDNYFEGAKICPECGEVF
jgi:hypothetical protein